jgi:hypothetical protein
LNYVTGGLKIYNYKDKNMTENNMPEQRKTRKEFETEIITKAWKDKQFKQELLSNPKAVYERELNQKLPDSLQIRVVEEDSNTIYLALPKAPEANEELSEEALESIAGGHSLVIILNYGPYILARWQ